MNAEVAEILRSNRGVIRRADHPGLVARLDHLVKSQVLRSPLPGILWLPELANDPAAAVLAGQLWAGPNGVLTGYGAARLTFWPDAPLDELTFASPRRQTVKRGRWVLQRRRIPHEYVQRHGTINVTAPALTAIDLAGSTQNGEVIDRVLRDKRRTGVTLPILWEALRRQPNRPGNGVRQALLDDSRDEPWSEGERLLHRLLRTAGIAGWRTNVHLTVSGDDYFADLLFSRQRLIIEFDGWRFHSSRDAFERDRRRRNELELAGYLVLNFTWQHLVDDPAWVLTCIRRALKLRRT